MTEVATRPAPVCRVWSRSRIIAEDLTGEDLSDVLELHSDASAWWILPREDHYGAAELKDVARALDLDELAIKDLLAEDRRAKFETIGQARLVITNAAVLDRDRAQLSAVPISIIATDRALICLVESSASFRPAQLLLGHEEQLTTGGVEAALQIVMEAIIRSYEEAVQWLEVSSDQLANVLFEERPLDKPEQLRAFKLRSALSQLRRLTDPMRVVMNDIVESPPTTAKSKTRNTSVNRQWKLLAEQHDRAANATDALREALASVFDTSLALADVRMNQNMKKLTGWAAIIAVPTLVTSFVGMNVRFPLVGSVLGFWIYFAVMIVAGVVLYFLFRAKDWV
ncbi:MAG TPA: CorA family divalent cation transporter [Propionibacteriaceae bacterium]|nr:CorA family divalent cation transporter [Propionibacteriaceae bacterium]